VLTGSSVATQLPWVVAVLAAPFWFGGVGQTCQIVLALLICGSLLLNFPQVRCIPESGLGKVVLAGIAGLILVSLLPVSRTLAPVPEFISMAKESAALSFAPGETVARAWQLGMVFACFALAREAIRIQGFLKAFAIGLALAILLMAGAEVWRMSDGHGVWIEARHYPGGTFANRNHFASWMVAGSMFVFGALLWKARKVRAGEKSGADWFELVLYGTAILSGIGIAMASGSRGGLLALAVGLVAWAGMLWRGRSRGLALALFGGLLICALAVFVVAGDATMSRASSGGLDFKVRIWREALELFAKFPWLGIGLGAFSDIFSAFKTFHGEGSILFVENEYLQWIVEMGTLGGVLAVLAALCFVRIATRAFRAERIPKCELFYGAVAAFVALCAHAFFEFVFHVPSIALLAAVLAGITVGLSQRAKRLVEPGATRGDFVGTALLAVLIGGVAVQQARAAQEWAAGSRAIRSEAVALWPLDSKRALEAARTAIAQGELNDSAANYIKARTILNQTLAWRPYNWELRLERAWLDVAFGKDLEDSLAEARAAILSNPLQPKIPLRFAAMLARQHPAHALAFVRSAPTSKYEDVREALRIGWMVSGEAAILWELTPAAPEGLRALAQFAREQNLKTVAEQAEARLRRDDGNHH
jgi:O-antigen ligase